MEEPGMPNPPQSFNIDARGNVNPTGNGAQMSRTGAGTLPNEGQWHASSQACSVTLPIAVWNVTPDPGKDTYTFSLAANATSATYSLKTTAPTGTQIYLVDTAPGLGGGQTEPSVVVNP
jgi:hypothetical protein